MHCPIWPPALQQIGHGACQPCWLGNAATIRCATFATVHFIDDAVDNKFPRTELPYYRIAQPHQSSGLALSVLNSPHLPIYG